MSAEGVHIGRPLRSTALGVTVALIVFWGAVRLVLTDTSVFPLAYALPLLVHVWTRDRLLLWLMAAIFVAFHTVKIFLLLPPGTFTPAESWANYGATLVNIAVATAAVELIIALRARLERLLDDLAQQNEELAVQAEELSNQTEELTQQGEELANQNEELQSQAEEIAALMETLERREKLLQTLLDTARLSGSEKTALDQVAAAATDLFAPFAARVRVYEQHDGRLLLRASRLTSTGADESPADKDVTVGDDFVALVLAQGRTASIADLTLRPDLEVPSVLPAAPARAVLAAPIRSADAVFGSLAIYSLDAHGWTAEEYRLAEWLADQCGRSLQALRIQSSLREADRRKSEFLATLSHELRNPLAAINFALELTEKGNSQDGQARKVMRRQLRQLVRLVDDLLDATRLSSNKVQIRKARVDLVRIVRNSLEAARPDIERAGHELFVDLPSQPVWLEADADRIDQVVTNLLSNAARYTDRSGRITISVSVTDDGACLTVADTGIGLERSDLERVFEMFMQVKGPGSGGLGIGLALVKGIVDLHGGHVEARSDGPGRGSEFRVVLPVTAVRHTEADEGQSAALVEADETYRVLVVDDNADSARMISALLELYGHTVRIAFDPEDAVAASGEFAPDAAVLDIGLPGIDGYELAERLRAKARTRDMRLIALTGWGQDADRARAEQAGFDVHLTKPADPTAVLEALRKRPARGG